MFAGYFLPRLDEWAPAGRGAGHDAIGMYVGLTGERIRGCDTYWLGIATHFCEQVSLAYRGGIEVVK
jgi:hypothetical protein